MVNVIDAEIDAILQCLMHIPEDIEEIMPRADEVWNCDEIVLDPNNTRQKIVCTYKWYNVDIVWKNQEGEHALFWFTLLFFTRIDGHVLFHPQ